MKECKSCGSPLAGSATDSKWNCEYCKAINYNENYINTYAKNIDYSKAHNLLKLGIAACEGHDYEKAINNIDEVLVEDSDNRDAWVYGAISFAHLANLSNLEKSSHNVESYLKKAEESKGDIDILEVGKSVSGNVIGATFLKAINQRYEAAEKNYNAFESTDKNKAKSRRENELKSLCDLAELSLKTPPDDPSVIGPIAVKVLLASRHYNGNKNVVSSAKSILKNIKNKNLVYYKSLVKDLNGSGKVMAISSFLFGLISIFIPFIFSIPAIICGHLAIKKINYSAEDSGKVFAFIGLLLGYLWPTILVLF